MHLARIRSGGGAPTAAIDWQREGGAKHVIRIIMPFGFDEPFGIATKALRCALYVASGEHIGISTRKRHGIEGCKCGSRPSPMSLLVGLVRPIGERRHHLDEDMVAAKPEGRGLLRHARGCPPEFVGENGTPRRNP